jgi:SAM-dependent methyltransferase
MFETTAHLYDRVYELAGKDYEAESAVIEQLVAERSPDAETLLDVACGTGGHLIHLQRRFQVAGVDLDAKMLEVARRRMPAAELVEADMRSFDLGRTFDAVTCLFSSVGYLPDRRALGDAIERMGRHVAPGGVLVVDGWVRPEAWREPATAHVVSGQRDGIAVARVGGSTRRGSTTILEFHHLVSDGTRVEHLVDRHELTLFADADYRDAFGAAGFEVTVTDGPTPGRDRYVGVRASA